MELMVSRVACAHFVRVVVSKVPKLVRVLLLGVFLFVLGQGVRHDDYEPLLVMAFTAAFAYMLSPILAALAKPWETRAEE